MIRRCTKKAAFKSASVKNSEYFTRQAYVKFIFYLFFRESPENMVFLEKKEQKVPRYKHIFTRLQISRLLTRKCPALIPVVFFIKCVNMLRPTKALSTLRRRNLKRRLRSENSSNVSLPHSVGKFENATISGHFGFVFEENSVREIT